MCGETLQTLRQKGLELAAYVESVQQMQGVVDGIFQQLSEYITTIWRIEWNAYVGVAVLNTF